MGKKRSGSSKLLLGLVIAIIGAGAFFFFEVFGPNTGSFTKDEYLYVRTGATYEQVVGSLQGSGMIRDMNGFRFVATALKLPEHIHPGRYRIKKGMSNYNIVRMLRAGKQEPVRLVVNKLRTKNDLIRLIATNLEADSFRLRELLRDPAFAAELGADTGTVMGVIMQDTYEFYWNTQAENVIRKIHKNHTRYWTPTRKQKAKTQGITPMQAIVIASIVEEETNLSTDKPNIASVYLNRIRKGMKLQADPTVKFAIGDFAIKRVNSAMLLYDSPYNTYMYEGLPPGPICTPSTASINAVLDAPHGTYLYFCAKDDLRGGTAFASTFEEQIRNANAYRRALDNRGIH
ncbi:endolytic transglycosylase MltG [Nemorincola caseinilytica]|uniref:Endolytic murein transglycosylase n=1 Tax=Nemorincola caseinilytica TaxID=2054315 RepID=A0ABP8N670_9BACT